MDTFECCTREAPSVQGDHNENTTLLVEEVEVEKEQKPVIDDTWEFGWKDLPLLVFRTLFQFLDYKTKIQLRSVCTQWLDTVDEEVGLIFQVDDTNVENMDFMRTVKIKELHVRKWFVPKVEQLHNPSEITGLGLYGIVCPLWFCSKTPTDFKFIKKLVLKGKFLSHLDLDKIPSVNSAAKTELPCYSPTLPFKYLEYLEMIADAEAFPMDQKFFTTNLDVFSPMKHNIVRTISSDVSMNICFLLNNIQSPRLAFLKVSTFQITGWNLPPNTNWKYHPLQRFLKNHADSLQSLNLPTYSGINDRAQLIFDVSEIPQNLKKLQIYLCCFLTRNRLGGTQNSSYWLKLILMQTKLEFLNLEMASFPLEYMSLVVANIRRNNADTLKIIELAFSPPEWGCLNGNSFSSCTSLEILKMVKSTNTRSESITNNGFTFSAKTDCKNLTHFPASLKILELRGFHIEISKPNRILRAFPHLEHVVLEALVADAKTEYENNVKMILEFFNLRSLKILDIYIRKPETFVPLTKVKHMVYKSFFLDEHVLTVNYMKAQFAEFGMQIRICEDEAAIRYSPAIERSSESHRKMVNVQCCLIKVPEGEDLMMDFPEDGLDGELGAQPDCSSESDYASEDEIIPDDDLIDALAGDLDVNLHFFP